MKAHESMDLGFTLQARCLEAVAKGKVGSESCVVPVPPEIDAAVASAYLELSRGTRDSQQDR
jgi:adenosylhomocysteinase